MPHVRWLSSKKRLSLRTRARSRTTPRADPEGGGPSSDTPRWLGRFSLVVTVLCGLAFGVVTENVLGHEELATHDSPFASWLDGHRNVFMTLVMRGATEFGSAWITVPACLLAAAVLPPRRRRSLAVALAVTVGASVLANVIKMLIGRARPDALEALVTTSNSSFPSAHATQAAAASVTIAYFACARWTRRGHRIAIWGVAAALVLLVGFSRLYLGAHWLTDVLGGYALGIAWATAVIMAARILSWPVEREDPRRPDVS